MTLIDTADRVDHSAAAAPPPVRRFEAQWIGGEWRTSTGPGRREVVDPASEQVVAIVPAGSPEDVDAAVAAAVGAFPAWSRTDLDERLRFLDRLVSGLARRTDELAETIMTEVGAPRQVAYGAHVGLALAMASTFRTATPSALRDQRIGNSLVTREAAGVVAAITPWNMPLLLSVQKVVPALLAGCTVVHKASEITPLSAYLLAEAMTEAGLPPGVFNLVVGDGPVVGAALARHPGVDVVSLTGSTRAGRDVARGAAETVKRVHLELGGKSANVVLPDADLERAVAANVDQVCFNSGQTCLQWSRLLVPRDREQEVLERAAALMSSYRVGDPRDPGTDLGPLVSADARDRVRAHVARGLQEGARLVTGGVEAPEGLDRGYYVRPTLLADVDSGMSVAQEEIFGPVLCVLPYDDEDHAVRIANDTAYGLHGAVWSADEERALAVARRLRTGLVDVNGGPFNPLAPFGGVKQSGSGRECGTAGVEEFTELKSCQLPVPGAEAVGPRLRAVPPRAG